MSAEVVPIGTPDLMNVPTSLRRLADQIERGDVAGSEHAIVVSMFDGEISIYGYGTVQDRAHEIGCLHMAIIKFATE